MVGWMRCGENFRYAIFVAFGFLEHRKLVGPDGLVFVDAGFHVPAGEVASIGAGECAGTEAAYGCALPETVIDVTGVEHGLFCAGGFERLALFLAVCFDDFAIGGEGLLGVLGAAGSAVCLT